MFIGVLNNVKDFNHGSSRFWEDFLATALKKYLEDNGTMEQEVFDDVTQSISATKIRKDLGLV